MTKHGIPKPWLFLTALTLGLLIAVPAAGLVASRLSLPSSDASPVPPALAVGVLEVRAMEGYGLRRVFTGRVEASRASGLGFERSGLLREVLVREGDPVAAGQVVARLDRALLQAKRRELGAALASVEADLTLAEATLGRYRQSAGKGAVTLQALDEARERASAARSRVDLARARIATLDLDLDKSELRAPFDGIVIRRLEDEGRVLGAGTPILTLQERATPEIRVGVAGPLADTLSVGSSHEMGWRGHSFPARLRALLPVRNLGTRTLDALFEPEVSPPRLRPGELVELRLRQRMSDPGVWLPVSALAEGARGLWQAYVAEPLDEASAQLAADHRIGPRPVEVLYQENDRVYVQGPLHGGDLVVSRGVHRIVPGQLVRVLAADLEQIAMEDR